MTLDRAKIFLDTYNSGEWGRKKGEEFCSGVGSHDPLVVECYLRGVRAIIEAIGGKPDVVDFGCGDFNVGSRIRPLCGRYVACDIVPELIEVNKHKFAALDVDFRALNAFEEDLPAGDIVFVRQVLQHMSNDDIMALLPKLRRFKFMIFTDHAPVMDNYLPNVPIETGTYTRIVKGSALSLRAHPFYLEPRFTYTLASVVSEGGVITTKAYQMY